MIIRNLVRPVSPLALSFCVVALAPAGCLMDTGEAPDEAIEEASAEVVSYTRTNWMSQLPDSKKLSKLVIPGTHDTAADNILGDVGETQDWNVPDQLNNGLRFLDVRVANTILGSNGQASDGGTYPFQLRHGVMVLGNFETRVLQPVVEFLTQHPGEVILMSVKDEDTLDKAAFVSRFITAAGSKFMTTANEATTLGQVRGKVVLFNRIGGAGGGVLWSSIEPWMQDVYNLTNKCGWVSYFPFYDCSIDYPAKAQKVVNHLKLARGDTGSHWWVNFASANWNGMYIGNSAAVANEAVRSYVTGIGSAPAFGTILPMDYPNRNSGVIDALIGLNFSAW